jgi:hypothetical protein
MTETSMFTQFKAGSRRTLYSLAAPALLAAGLFAGVATAPAAWAQSNDATAPKPGFEEHMKEMQAHHAEMMKRGLDAAAERLELKASQMPAWQTFAAAFTALHEPAPGAMQARAQFDKLDAAGLAKMISDHAADHARKLATVADATAKLQATMSDSQKALFTEMARHHLAHRFHHHHHGGPGWGHHEGHDGGPDGDHMMHDGDRHQSMLEPGDANEDMQEAMAAED